jgi:hypothetical protein
MPKTRYEPFLGTGQHVVEISSKLGVMVKNKNRNVPAKTFQIFTNEEELQHFIDELEQARLTFYHAGKVADEIPDPGVDMDDVLNIPTDDVYEGVTAIGIKDELDELEEPTDDELADMEKEIDIEVEVQRSDIVGRLESIQRKLENE